MSNQVASLENHQYILKKFNSFKVDMTKILYVTWRVHGYTSQALTLECLSTSLALNMLMWIAATRWQLR